jgi:hypothetical protein
MSRLDRRTTILLAVLMPLGPVLVAVLRGVLPTFSATTAAETATAVANAPGRQSAVVWLSYAAALTLAPGVLAAATLTRRYAPRLTWWAVALLVPAYLSMGGLFASDVLVWSGNDAGLGTGAVARLLDHTHPAAQASLVVFVIGHVVGTLLLGLAVLRTRRVPAVLAWALALSQPLHFVAFVILGVQALDVFAWGLTTAGMAAVAWALLHEPETSSVRVPQPAFAEAAVGG